MSELFIRNFQSS